MPIIKEKSIIFHTDEVQSTLAGIKSQFRRVIKPQPELKREIDLATLNDVTEENFWHWKDCKWIDGGLGFPESGIEDYAPYHPGDILWVKETWCKLWHLDDRGKFIDGTETYYYAADGYNPTPFNCFPDDNGFYGTRDCPRWRSSIHMPRAAARIFLRVTNVRVERVQEIIPEDCHAEGIMDDVCAACLENGDCHPQTAEDAFCGHDEQIVERYAELWDSHNAKRGYGWDANPWVWVTEYECVTEYETIKRGTEA